MAPFGTLFCLFLALVSFARGDVLYVLGDEVVSVTDAGFSALSGTKASCSGTNVAKAMASYIAGPKTTIVPVTVSLCGAFLSSDVLAGLDWIEGDIDYRTTNHVALAVNLAKAGSAASVVESHVASFIANRAVVSTMQGFWTQKGVLLMPNATAPALGPPPSPPPAAQPPVPEAPEAPPSPDPVVERCDPVWKRVVFGESAVLATILVCLCFVLGVWCAKRPRRDPRPCPSYASQSPRGAPMYPMYQHESIRMPPFVGAGSPPPERAVPDRDTRSTPDLSGPRSTPDTSGPRFCLSRETASSPDVMATRWVPDGGVWEHVPTRYSRDGPYGDLGMEDRPRSERSAPQSPTPPPRISISMSGIHNVRSAGTSRAKRQDMFAQTVDPDVQTDKQDKTNFDFRRRGSGQSPETMSSSRETPTNLSEHTPSKHGSF
jgi:hypothetical protein